MSKIVTSKRFNKAKNVSHANNKQNRRQNLNCQYVTINGVKFIKGCNYEVDNNPFIGIMIYAPFGYINISKWQLDNYFI